MNIKSIISVVALGFGVGLLSTAASAGTNTTLVLQMLGNGEQVGDLAEVSARVGVDLSGKDLGFALTDFACHEMPLIDPATKMKLGSGIDCLAGITPDDKGGMTLTGVSIFLLPGGTIISKGGTSAAPFIDGVGSGDGARSHITGAIPMSDNILATTGDFEGMTGKSRLSGMIKAGGEKMMFDCLFVLDLKHT